MDTPLRYALAALVFAVIWSIFMVLQSGDYSTANIVISALGGLFTGAVWVLVMAWYQRRRLAHGK